MRKVRRKAIALSKEEAGAIIAQAIKEYLRSQGASTDTIPSDFPVSARTIYNIQHGIWTEKLLESLPFQVTVEYSIKIGGLPIETAQAQQRTEIVKEYQSGVALSDLAEKYGQPEKELYKFLRGVRGHQVKKKPD